MIDRDVFAAGMGVLAGAFGRNVDETTIATYYRVLAARLTTRQFERAVKRAVSEETYWPAPAMLLKLAKRDSEAAMALMRVSDELNAQHGYRFASHEWYSSLSDEVKAGIQAVGGLRVISTASVKDWPRVERRFTQAYNARAAELADEARPGEIAAPRGGAPRIAPKASTESTRESTRERQLPPGDDTDDADDRNDREVRP